MQKHLTSREKAEIIKSAVSMPDVIARFAGLSAGASGRRRIPCPIHGGEGANLGYDSSTFHCFTCGAKGDVIDFVMQIHRCSFGDAVGLLDTAFGLGLDNLRDDARRNAEALIKEREAENARRREVRRIEKSVLPMFGRIQRWAIHRPTQTDMHTRCVAAFDRVLDDLHSGKRFSSDPRAFARSWVWAVRKAEKEARHGG